MELTKFLAALAVYLPIVYGAPTTAADSLHPAILAAMKRDLGLDAEQAHVRVAREIKATEVIEQVRTLAGNSFGGAWLVDGELNVAVTDEALTSELAAAGATPLIVSTPLSKLEEAQKALDKIDIEQALDKRSGENGIAAYYVDVAANKLILEALSGSVAQAEELAKQVGLVESEFEVRTVGGLPTTFATVRGGDAYLINLPVLLSPPAVVLPWDLSRAQSSQETATTATSVVAVEIPSVEQSTTTAAVHFLCRVAPPLPSEQVSVAPVLPLVCTVVPSAPWVRPYPTPKDVSLVSPRPVSAPSLVILAVPSTPAPRPRASPLEVPATAPVVAQPTSSLLMRFCRPMALL
jgi:hypothetical protein